MKRKVILSIALISLIGLISGCTNSAKSTLKNNIDKNCDVYTSDLNAKFGGGEAEKNGIVDVGICDGKYTKHTVSNQKLFEKYTYEKEEYQFNDEAIINNIFTNSLYYTVYKEEENKYWVDIILSGEVCGPFDSYKEDVIELIEELQKKYNTKKEIDSEYGNFIIFHMYLTPERNFQEDPYYKATLVYDIKRLDLFRVYNDKVKLSESFVLNIKMDDQIERIIEKFEEANKSMVKTGC